MAKDLTKKYLKSSFKGSFTGLNSFYNALKKENKKLKKSSAFEAIKKEDTYQLHKPIHRNFQKAKVLVSGIDDTWQADLVDMQAAQKDNNNFRYILTVIDVFSKYAWAIPIKYKKGEEIVDAFEKIFKSKRVPNKIQVDQGKEFHNKEFKTFLSTKNIKMYSTNSELKASVVERFNRTLKERMWRLFTYQKNNNYLEDLPKLVNAYNNSYHRTIKMEPSAVNKSNENKVYYNIYGYYKDNGNENTIKIAYKKDDLVRIYRYKYLFTKGYEKNWSDEIFKIYKIIPNDPPYYKIKDLKGEEIEGNFYTQELQKIEEEDLSEGEYEIEKILDTRIRKGKEEILVKWKGYPDSENSWVLKSSLK